MKNKNQYNRFIQFGNAPVCVYGKTIVRSSLMRGKHSLLMKCWNYFLRKASG